MTDPLLQVTRAWREEAQRIRHRYTDDRLARLCEVHAEELELALAREAGREITLDEAAQISGFSKAHLRRLMDGGVIPNVGGPGAPRVRVGDLPIKAGRASALTASAAFHRAVAEPVMTSSAFEWAK